jgi:hypothetical protein
MLVTPLTGVAQENTVSNNLPEQPNDVEGLVAQIRTVVDEILQRYGHIPMVSSLCNVILNSLGLIVFWVICWVIFIICILFVPVLWFCYLMGLDYFVEKIFWNVLLVADIIDSECPDIFSPPIKSLYTMLETKDNINTFDGCPCLQE